MEKTIFHIDVNSAFLSWEAVHRLKELKEKVDLRETLSAIGGDRSSRKGIIVAKSLSTKPYGVKTGESIMEALKKCPALQIYPGNYQVYSRYSAAFFDILESYTPDVEKYSVDEAFLDMTGTKNLWGSPLEAAHTIKDRIYNELGFTVNVGVSSVKILAKMASDFQKPNLVHTLYPEEVPAKMWPLPVSDLFSVGKATLKRLKEMEIKTIGDLANTDLNVLNTILRGHGETLWNYANGRDFSTVGYTKPKVRGYGNSTTLKENCEDLETAQAVLLYLADKVGERLRRDHVKISVVATTIKYHDFKVQSHQATLESSTDISKVIYQSAVALFKELWDFKTPIRLLGISTSYAKKETEVIRQLSLFDDMPLENETDFQKNISPNQDKLSKADRMADEIRTRFGKDAVKKAVLIQK